MHMKVRELMTTDVAIASPDSTLEEVASMMKEDDIGAVPILDEDQLVGVVTDRDIVVRCIAEGKDPTETNVEDILSDNPVTIDLDADVDEAARVMADHQVRRLPVVEDGVLVGIISLGDIAVKEQDEEPAAEALEGVSRGVKAGGREQRRAQAGQRKGKFGKTQSASVAEQEEIEEEAGEYAGQRDARRDRELRLGAQSGQSRSGRATSNMRGRASSGGPQGRASFGSSQEQPRKSQQSAAQSGREQATGISNRNLGEERSRQQKVTAKRSEAKASGRRKAS
jgi:CBS domain-containing protein